MNVLRRHRRLLPVNFSGVIPPAVNGDDLTVDELRCWLSQEFCNPRYVLRLNPSFEQRVADGNLLPDIRGMMSTIRLDPSWSNAIHAHLGRQLFGKAVSR